MKWQEKTAQDCSANRLWCSRFVWFHAINDNKIEEKKRHLEEKQISGHTLNQR